MLLSRLSLDLIIHESCNIVLQISSQLIDDRLVGTFGEVNMQLHVCLEDLLVAISQVILTAVCA